MRNHSSIAFIEPAELSVSAVRFPRHLVAPMLLTILNVAIVFVFGSVLYKATMGLPSFRLGAALLFVALLDSLLRVWNNSVPR